MAVVTEEELLEALRQALQDGQQAGQDEHAAGALTVAELSDALGWYAEKVRQRLRVLKAQDAIEVLKVHREAIDGSRRVSPAYRIKVEEESV